MYCIHCTFYQCFVTFQTYWKTVIFLFKCHSGWLQGGMAAFFKCLSLFFSLYKAKHTMHFYNNNNNNNNKILLKHCFSNIFNILNTHSLYQRSNNILYREQEFKDLTVICRFRIQACWQVGSGLKRSRDLQNCLKYNTCVA